MTVLCLDWETIHLHGEAWISHHRLRHRLFVERHRWDVPSYNGLEYDQFDTPAAKYLLWMDEENKARASARLIPTTRHYMVQTLWPDWIEGALPETPLIWEATRFGCDRDLPSELRRQAVAELICACQTFGIANGIKKYLGVMPVSIFKRVIAGAGCPVEFLCSPRCVDGHPTVAAYIHVSRDVLETVRRRAGLPQAPLDLRPKKAA